MLVNNKEKDCEKDCELRLYQYPYMKVNLLQKNKISRFSNVVKCTLDIPRVNMLSEIGYWRIIRVETVDRGRLASRRYDVKIVGVIGFNEENTFKKLRFF